MAPPNFYKDQSQSSNFCVAKYNLHIGNLLRLDFKRILVFRLALKDNILFLKGNNEIREVPNKRGLPYAQGG